MLLLERIETGHLLADGDDGAVGERRHRQEAQHADEGEQAKLADPAPAPARNGRLGAVSAQKRHGAARLYRRMKASQAWALKTGAWVGASTPPARSIVAPTLEPFGSGRSRRTTVVGPPPRNVPARCGAMPGVMIHAS